jgi:hypothetical protein
MHNQIQDDKNLCLWREDNSQFTRINNYLDDFNKLVHTTFTGKQRLFNGRSCKSV